MGELSGAEPSTTSQLSPPAQSCRITSPRVNRVDAPPGPPTSPRSLEDDRAEEGTGGRERLELRGWGWEVGLDSKSVTGRFPNERTTP